MGIKKPHKALREGVMLKVPVVHTIIASGDVKVIDSSRPHHLSVTRCVGAPAVHVCFRPSIAFSII